MQSSVPLRDRPAAGRLSAASHRRRAEFLCLASLAVAFSLAWWMGWTLAGRGFTFNDFHDYWLAAKLVTQGRSVYDLEALRALAAAEGLPFVVGTGYSYPLPFAILMVPFAALPFTPAVLLFNAVSLVIFGVTVAGWIGWAHGSERAAFGRRAALAFAAGCYPPVFGTIANGQANLLLLGLLGAGTALILGGQTRNRSFLGGVAIGLAAIVKVIPGLLLVPLGLARRGAASGGLLAGALGCLLVADWLWPWAAAGSERLGSLFEPDAYFTNQSINGFISRLVHPTSRTVALWPDAPDPRLTMFLLTVGFALATGLVLWRARTHLAQPRGLSLGIALTLIAGLITAPKGSFWTQALALVAVGLVLAVDVPDLRLARLGRTDLALMAIWFGGAVIQTLLWVQPPATTISLAPLVTILTSASLIGMLALWSLAVRRLEWPPPTI